MAKRLSKNVRELLNDKFKVGPKDYPLRPFTKEEKEFRKQALEEMYDIRSYNNSKSLHSQNIDMTAIEEGSQDGYGRPVTKSQYIKQESHARQRCLMSVWEQDQPEEDENGIERDIYAIPMDRLPTLIVDLPPLKQLAIDIVSFQYDSIGPSKCQDLIDEVFNTEMKKKYANPTMLLDWKQNCEYVIRKIVSIKKAWISVNKIQ
jgi:hypothetical protein